MQSCRDASVYVPRAARIWTAMVSIVLVPLLGSFLMWKNAGGDFPSLHLKS